MRTFSTLTVIALAATFGCGKATKQDEVVKQQPSVQAADDNQAKFVASCLKAEADAKLGTALTEDQKDTINTFNVLKGLEEAKAAKGDCSALYTELAKLQELDLSQAKSDDVKILPVNSAKLSGSAIHGGEDDDSRSLGQRPIGLPSAAPSYGQSSQGYGQSSQGYGQGSQGYGQGSQGYGASDPTYQNGGYSQAPTYNNNNYNNNYNYNYTPDHSQGYSDQWQNCGVNPCGTYTIARRRIVTVTTVRHFEIRDVQPIAYLPVPSINLNFHFRIKNPYCFESVPRRRLVLSVPTFCVRLSSCYSSY